MICRCFVLRFSPTELLRQSDNDSRTLKDVTLNVACRVLMTVPKKIPKIRESVDDTLAMFPPLYFTRDE